MRTRKRGKGYFGKTGTVSRERRPRRKMSRREFLAGATVTGVVLTAPSWLVGCGSDDDAPPPRARPREQHTLHFDFSFAPLRDLVLNVHNSPSHRAPILEHTAESRARHREMNPSLADIRDERLTHYIEDVDLPSDALQMVWITGAHADNGEDVVAGLHIHAPAAARQAAHRRALAAGGTSRRSATGLAYGIGTNGQTSREGVLMGTDNYQTPVSTAVALVFHSPEIMNLNVDQGTTILQMIQTLPCTDDPTCTPYLGSLATQIAEKWPATTSGGWATLVQVMDADNQPVFDSQNKPAYRYDLDADIAQAVTAVAAEVRKAIFDDPQFRGTNWHPTEGRTVSQGTASSGAAAGVGTTTRVGTSHGAGSCATPIPTGVATASPGAAQFSLAAANPAGTTNHGVAFESISVINQASRTVELQFRNQFLRYLSTYVQFANENTDLQVANPTSDDTSRAQFLGLINSNYTVLGFPLFGDEIPLSSVQFDVPTDASIAKVYFGSLGLGGEAFSPEALRGSIMTLIFNIGVPSLLLAAGVAATGALLSALAEETEQFIGDYLRAVLPLILGIVGPDVANGIFGTANSKSATDALISLGSAVLSGFFASGQGAAILVRLGVIIATGRVVDSLGPLGLAFQIIAVLADLATIIQSVAEVLSSPAIFINQIGLTQTTTVTISHDPCDFQFPATARNYEVRLVYDTASKLAHVMSGTIEPGRVDPIVAVFDNVPSGGMVTVDVYLTTETGCIVGRSTGTDGNPGPYGPVTATQAAFAIAIKELLIPLTQTTQYLHDVKLEYQNGAHVWVETDAPTATLADLGQGQDDALYDLNGITISQRTGMAGYAYRAGGQGVPFCGEPVSGIAYMVQNVFLGENPERGLKQLPCGFQQVAGIVYDRLGPVSGDGRYFFLLPTPQGFFVQSIVLDDSTPIDVNNPLSWGVFSEGLDSLAVVPTGYVVGVNRQNHHMQILELPSVPIDGSQAPQAVPFAVAKMGLGTREGLLSAPVAVAVFDATILILEDGNQRIQAVDVSGNPVKRFQNMTSSVVALDQGSDISYLDLAVEGMGYIYVLSYVNNGLTAADYRLDIYDPQGNHLTRTTGVAAARLAVDTFRNVYTLNYEVIATAPRIEPSLSQWNPSTPEGCPTVPPVTPAATATPTP